MGFFVVAVVAAHALHFIFLYSGMFSQVFKC